MGDTRYSVITASEEMGLLQGGEFGGVAAPGDAVAQQERGEEEKQEERRRALVERGWAKHLWRSAGLSNGCWVRKLPIPSAPSGV